MMVVVVLVVVLVLVVVVVVVIAVVVYPLSELHLCHGGVEVVHDHQLDRRGL